MESAPSPSPPQRQTQSYLRSLFRQRGLEPKNKLGQNFLIDLNLIDFIVRAAELTRDDVVLEIGTGTGSLTARLAAEAGHVLSVEIDADFHALARENLVASLNVTLLHGDVLRNKNTLNPEVLESLRRIRRDLPMPRLKLVANLPYAVATPALSNLLLTDLPWERMVATVQWEIGERLAAVPGTKDYSALSVLVQSVADVEILRRLAPTVFWPRPQVASAIVQIKPSAAKRARVPDVHGFRVFLRDLYSHRRKNLRGALVSFPGAVHDKASVDAKLAALGIDGNTRAETLTVEDHLRLAAAFARPTA